MWRPCTKWRHPKRSSRAVANSSFLSSHCLPYSSSVLLVFLPLPLHSSLIPLPPFNSLKCFFSQGHPLCLCVSPSASSIRLSPKANFFSGQSKFSAPSLWLFVSFMPLSLSPSLPLILSLSLAESQQHCSVQVQTHTNHVGACQRDAAECLLKDPCCSQAMMLNLQLLSSSASTAILSSSPLPSSVLLSSLLLFPPPSTLFFVRDSSPFPCSRYLQTIAIHSSHLHTCRLASCVCQGENL